MVLAPAAAQGGDEARLAFERGVAAYETGSFEEALASFQRSYELTHDPQILYNIATVADRLRRDAVALEAYEGYLAGLPEADDRANVEARIAALRAAIAADQPAPEVEPIAEPPPTEVMPVVEPEPAPPSVVSGGVSEGGIALTIAGGVLAVAGGALLIFTAVDLEAASRAMTWAELMGPYERVPIVSAVGWLALGVGVGVAAIGVGWLVAGSGAEAPRVAVRLGPGQLAAGGTF